MERVFTFASIKINAVSVCLLEKQRPSFYTYHTYDTNVGRV